MSRTIKGTRAIALYLVSALAAFAISFSDYARMSIPNGLAKLVGILLVVLGAMIGLWATMHMKWGLLGEVEPRLDQLIQTGPYRYIRHPVYLAVLIALSGVPIALRSSLGLIAVFVLFLPSVIYRAGLEDRALKRKFGRMWDDYAAKRGFILPIRR